MNDAFQEREKSFERKFKLDQDQQFRAQSRRDRIFGEWVAGKLGLWGNEIEAYSVQVLDSNFEKPGDEDMLDKVKADLQAKQITISDGDLRTALLDAYGEAARQISGASKK
jgi:hypothetical protein